MMPSGVAIATVLVYILITSVRSEELKSTLLTCSPKCQYTATNCLLQSSTASQEVNARKYCRLFQINNNGLTAYHCLVRLGLCTDGEFDRLQVAACGGATRNPENVNEAKTFFYSAVDGIGKSCQKELLVCVKASSVATVYKQHERFCFLMGLDLDNFNFRSCLLQNNKCEYSEYARLNSSACKRTARRVGTSEFFNALLLTSPTCRNGLDYCSISSKKALDLIESERYCDALHVEEDGKSAYNCLVQPNRCEINEYTKLKESVCSNGDKMVLTMGTIISCLLAFSNHIRI